MWTPEDFVTWASSLADRAHSALYLVWVQVRAWVRTLLGLSHAAQPQHEPKVYRVYVFNEGTGPGFYREIPLAYFDASTWESDARELTGWSAFRMEVRYTFRHKKYRMVLRPGDTCPFPPYDEPSACRLPKGVLSARLLGSGDSADSVDYAPSVDCDVTHRVIKYQGPKGDFHAGLGLRVKVQDMFPFDDHDDNAARFSHLRLMDVAARLHDLPYEDNPAVDI